MIFWVMNFYLTKDFYMRKKVEETFKPLFFFYNLHHPLIHQLIKENFDSNNVRLAKLD